MKNVNNRQNGDHPSLHIRKSHTKCDFSYLIFIYNMIQYILCIHIMCKTGTTLSVYIYIFFFFFYIQAHRGAHKFTRFLVKHLSLSAYSTTAKKKTLAAWLAEWLGCMVLVAMHTDVEHNQRIINTTHRISCVWLVCCVRMCASILY